MPTAALERRPTRFEVPGPPVHDELVLVEQADDGGIGAEQRERVPHDPA
jgi:hypothetical protein